MGSGEEREPEGKAGTADRQTRLYLHHGSRSPGGTTRTEPPSCLLLSVTSMSVCAPSTRPGAPVKCSPLTRSLFPPSAGAREPEVHRSGVRLHQQRGEMQHPLHRPLRLCHKLQNCPVSAHPPPSPLPAPAVRTAQGASAPPRVTFPAKHGGAGGSPVHANPELSAHGGAPAAGC